MARKPNPELQEKVAALKREQILQAARSVFAEKGFHRATIKEIAARAGVADGTVYNYFANKNALLLGLLDWINQSDRRESDFQQLQEGNTEAFVREYTRQRFAFLGGEGLKLFQAILPEILANAELRSLYREKIIAPTFASADHILLPLLRGQDPARSLEIDQAKLILRLEAALMVGLIVLRIIGDDHLEAYWDKAPDLVADFMLSAFGLLEPTQVEPAQAEPAQATPTPKSALESAPKTTKRAAKKAAKKATQKLEEPV